MPIIELQSPSGLTKRVEIEGNPTEQDIESISRQLFGNDQTTEDVSSAINKTVEMSNLSRDVIDKTLKWGEAASRERFEPGVTPISTMSAKIAEDATGKKPVLSYSGPTLVNPVATAVNEAVKQGAQWVDTNVIGGISDVAYAAGVGFPGLNFPPQSPEETEMAARRAKWAGETGEPTTPQERAFKQMAESQSFPVEVGMKVSKGLAEMAPDMAVSSVLAATGNSAAIPYYWAARMGMNPETGYDPHGVAIGAAMPLSGKAFGNLIPKAFAKYFGVWNNADLGLLEKFGHFGGAIAPVIADDMVKLARMPEEERMGAAREMFINWMTVGAGMATSLGRPTREFKEFAMRPDADANRISEIREQLKSITDPAEATKLNTELMALERFKLFNPLHSQNQAIFNEAVKNLSTTEGGQVPWVWTTLPNGKHARYNEKTGMVELDPKNIETWMNLQRARGMGDAQLNTLMKRLMKEEALHSQDTPEDALTAWNNATSSEKRLAKSVYTGNSKGEMTEVDAQGNRVTREATEVELGRELIRMTRQRLNRLGVTEFAEMAITEKVKLGALQYMTGLLNRMSKKSAEAWVKEKLAQEAKQMSEVVEIVKERQVKEENAQEVQGKTEEVKPITGAEPTAQTTTAEQKSASAPTSPRAEVEEFRSVPEPARALTAVEETAASGAKTVNQVRDYWRNSTGEEMPREKARELLRLAAGVEVTPELSSVFADTQAWRRQRRIIDTKYGPGGSDRARYLSEEERRTGMTKEIADLQAAAAMYRERGEDGMARLMDSYAAQVQKSLDELGQQSFPGGSRARTDDKTLLLNLGAPEAKTSKEVKSMPGVTPAGVTPRALTPSEQREFEDLSFKLRAQRERGGSPLTPEESKRYRDLEGLAGQTELPIEGSTQADYSFGQEIKRLANLNETTRWRIKENLGGDARYNIPGNATHSELWATLNGEAHPTQASYDAYISRVYDKLLNLNPSLKSINAPEGMDQTTFKWHVSRGVASGYPVSLIKEYVEKYKADYRNAPEDVRDRMWSEMKNEAIFPAGSMRVAEALKRAQAAEERRARKAAELKNTEMFPGMFREALAPGIPKEERALPENAYFRATPEKIEETAKAAFDLAFRTGGAPSFDKFMAGVRSGFGESITPGQIRELWRDTMNKELNNARGKDLESLVDQLQLRRKLTAKGQDLTIPDAGAPDASVQAKALDVRAKALEAARRMNLDADRLEAESRKAPEAPVGYSKLISEAEEARRIAEEARNTALRTEDQGIKKSASLRWSSNLVKANKLEKEAAKMSTGELFSVADIRKSAALRAKALRAKADQIIQEARNYEETGTISTAMAEQPEFFGTLKETGAPAEQSPAQRMRTRAITEITLELSRRSSESYKPNLNRSDISINDIRWNAKENEYPWFSVNRFELQDPVSLGLQLTEGAASNASTKASIAGGKATAKVEPLPRSATKRLTAMLDKSGRVHLVSSYRHTRNGPSLFDPLQRGDVHTPLADLLRRGYRPIYSMLLDEPVQNFHKVYKNIKEFNETIANRANDLAQQRVRDVEDVVNESPEPIEGTEGVTPIGVGGIGPERKVAEAIAGESPGAIESRSRITPSEAQSVVDTIGQAKDSGEAAQIVDRIVGKMESRRNVVSADAYNRVADLYDRLVDLNLRRTRTLSDATEKKLAKQIEETQQQIDKLEGVTEQGAITTQERLFINALAKAARAKQRSMPEEVVESQTDPYLKSEVVTDLWEAAKEGPRFLEEYFSGNRPAELPTKPFVSPTAREFIAPRAAAPIKTTPLPVTQTKGMVQSAAAKRIAAAEARAQERALWKAAQIRKTPMEPSEQERRTAEMQKIIEDVEREIAAEAATGEAPGGSMARAMRKSAGYTSDVVTDFFSFWDEHMIPRLARQGGPEAKRLAAEFYKMQDQTKKNLGRLSPVLDPALQATGGSKMIPLLGNVPSPKNIKAVKLLNQIEWTNDTAGTARTVGAMESTINPRLIPAFARDVIDKMRRANIAIGGILQAVIPGFLPTGKFARNLTGEGYDILLRGAGEAFTNWVEGIAEANNKNPLEIYDFMRDWKEKLVSPTPDMAEIERVNQDFVRRYPKVITHIKTSGYLGMKHLVEVVHSDPFNYLRMAAVRASHVKAFRQSYPPNTAGKDRFAEDVAKSRTELSDNGNEFSGVLEGITRTLQGRPTDVYKEGLLAPGSNAAYAFRWANATVGNTLARMVLSGQMLIQPAETVAGSTPAWLGYRNTIRAAARLKHLYAQMEQEGMVNRVMYDWTYNPNAKVRSAFRQLQAGLSKAAAEQLLNEVQEGMAGATAWVTAERIMAGTLSRWERRQLPQTFRAMGFTPAEVNRMMAGDAALLGRFKRTAAMWLTTGNKLVGESSKLGANRRYNSIFRFSSYPMMRLQHFRKATSGMLDAFANDTPNKMAATEQFLRIAGFGALQGALTVAVGDLVMSAVSGSADPLRKRKAEIMSNPAEFIFESALASIGGPLYLLYRGASKGVGGMANSLARMAFPFAVGQDLVEAFSDTGRYRDMSTIDRIGKFLAGKTPAVKIIGPALARAGWGHADPVADNAISGYFNWLGDQEGGAERMRFREYMKAMVNAKRKGDYKKADELLQKALGAATEFADPGKEGQAVAASLRGRKILRNKDGGPLTDEQRADFIKKEGQAAYDKLEALDEMLDALAEEAMLP